MLASNSQIATRHQLATGSGGHALDRCNDRLRQRDNGLHHFSTQREGFYKGTAPAIRSLPPRGHFPQIMAGTKNGAFGIDYNNPNGRILRYCRKLITHGGHHGQRQGITALRTMKGQSRDSTLVMAQERRGYGRLRQC